MELSNLVTYKSSFSILRITLLLVIVIFTCSFIGLYYYTSRELEKANNRVFLLEASGNMMVAGAMDVVSKQDFELMVEDHIRDFYHLFFSFLIYAYFEFKLHSSARNRLSQANRDAVKGQKGSLARQGPPCAS